MRLLVSSLKKELKKQEKMFLIEFKQKPVRKIEVVKQNNGEVVGITSIADRGIQDVDFGFDYKPLLKYPVQSWGANNVPSWLAEIPLTQRGRSGK